MTQSKVIGETGLVRSCRPNERTKTSAHLNGLACSCYSRTSKLGHPVYLAGFGDTMFRIVAIIGILVLAAPRLRR
jgi:hypothetical protein